MSSERRVFQLAALARADVPQIFNRYLAPICLMTRAGLTPVVEQLLDDGADPDGLGEGGKMFLYAAALLGHMDLGEHDESRAPFCRRYKTIYSSSLATALLKAV